MKMLFTTFCSQNRCRQGLIGTVLGSLFLVAVNVHSSSGLAEYDQPWEICALCHSLDGNSHMARFPKLAGQRKAYIEKQLDDFLNGRRQNDGGQMSSIVTEVDRTDFTRIAEWYSSQQAPVPQEIDAASKEIGKALFLNAGCNRCHNEQIQDPLPNPVPLLSSQHAAYTLKQLEDFQHDRRTHVDDDATNKTIMGYSDQELTSISDYLSATPRR